MDSLRLGCVQIKLCGFWIWQAAFDFVSGCRQWLNDLYYWFMHVPAQSPSEPLSAVALAQLNQADKGCGPKTLACQHTLHIVVA